tara:strand:- start:1249 stop:1710 length:462 start_codon:yes stop_codon:yes gene_type:complete
MLNNDGSCDSFLETTHGKLAVVAIAILAASQHIICGLVVALVFVMITNVHRDGFTNTTGAKTDLVKLDTNMLLKSPAIKTAFRDKVCHKKQFIAQSPDNQKLVSDMTKTMTMKFPHGPCNPCSDASAECHFEITDGYDQLHAAPQPQPTRLVE